MNCDYTVYGFLATVTFSDISDNWEIAEVEIQSKDSDGNWHELNAESTIFLAENFRFNEELEKIMRETTNFAELRASKAEYEEELRSDK